MLKGKKIGIGVANIALTSTIRVCGGLCFKLNSFGIAESPGPPSILGLDTFPTKM